MKISKLLAMCLTTFMMGSAVAANQITIKVGDNWSATHPMAVAVDTVFKPMVEKGTNGAVKVDIYHSGTLGNEADLWNGVRNGTIEFAVVGSVMNQEYPNMLISDWPFLYRNLSHAKNVWTGPVGEEFSAGFNQKFPTVRVLGWGPNSARTFTSNKKLTSIADFKGQKFRMPSNPIHVGIAKSLGASAQVIPLGDLFSSLETGVVDGQDNGMVTVVSESYYEVQKYLYETNHIIATLGLVASEPFMKKLTPAQQKVVADAAKAATQKAWDSYVASVDKDRTFLKSRGMTITPLSDADRLKMIAAIKPVTDKLYADNSWAKPLAEKIQAVK